jgi:hypothetical protein
VPERLWAGPDRSSSQTWKERALGAGHDLIEEVVRVGVRFHTGMAKYTAHLVDADLVILPTRIRLASKESQKLPANRWLRGSRSGTLSMTNTNRPGFVTPTYARIGVRLWLFTLKLTRTVSYCRRTGAASSSLQTRRRGCVERRPLAASRRTRPQHYSVAPLSGVGGPLRFAGAAFRAFGFPAIRFTAALFGVSIHSAAFALFTAAYRFFSPAMMSARPSLSTCSSSRPVRRQQGQERPRDLP